MTLPENFDHIPELDPTNAHAVDWDRVRAAIKAARPVRTLTVIGLATVPALVWADRVAVPVTEAVSVDAAFSTAFITSMVCAIGMATGGRVRRWACAALLVAAIGGTLIAEPTRSLIAAWIVGA
ncbi:hypothetical protein OHA84_38705 [Streptomyces sp. NBC_00513]|uniref:hypothetical protein n=1 Tax=unclassified Streptomyces TaxID=2593676 RepID=UPI0022597F80|nr:hypothetical protein [Streptomyces sp. NBC_00424]MCX5079380.1 hypothetical protein [Streptomyces sp. NBC_00424]MCX5079390.1 hypothetical protein [Streptomyces sp. NBC_00424]WUD46462.1 hypothetical protein OHA84_38755 [Streptomyces sp. NBC_00513]WUD46472.1 hypothetical protein OHA84_38705 [Streptomyces sp. NBC_00513]